MLKGPEKEGSMKVINKGVDAAIVTTPSQSRNAFDASRILAVCGISTAVLEECLPEHMDLETLKFYEDRIPLFFSAEPVIYKALKKHLPENIELRELKSSSGGMELAQEIRRYF